MDNITLLSGTAAVTETFTRAKLERRATFMPYWMIGYPDLPRSIAIIQALIDAGADIIECGVPFSDPVADGVAIQAAGQIALNNHATLADCIQAVQELRAANRNSGRYVPLLLMSYINPMLAYGLDRYTADTVAAGGDGFIVPDLPPEESHDLQGLCATHQLALVGMLAPTSSPDRIKLVAETSKGFIYLVSVTGVTGAREAIPADLTTFIARVRAVSDLPLSIGFGINRPEQAKQIAQIADGIIVGSALIREGVNGIDAVRKLAEDLRAAC